VALITADNILYAWESPDILNSLEVPIEARLQKNGAQKLLSENQMMKTIVFKEVRNFFYRQ